MQVGISSLVRSHDMPPVEDDFADGLMGGPDYWRVSGLARGDTLNMRDRPSQSGMKVGELAEGDIVRNRGCRMNGGTRWCEIETMDDMAGIGWVAGRYLREAGAPGVSRPRQVLHGAHLSDGRGQERGPQAELHAGRGHRLSRVAPGAHAQPVHVMPCMASKAGVN